MTDLGLLLNIADSVFSEYSSDRSIVVLPWAGTSKFHCRPSVCLISVPEQVREPVTVTDSVPSCPEAPPTNANQKSVPIVVNACPDTLPDKSSIQIRNRYILLVFIT